MVGNYIYTEKETQPQSASHGGNSESDLTACWIGLKRQLWTLNFLYNLKALFVVRQKGFVITGC